MVQPVDSENATTRPGRIVDMIVVLFTRAFQEVRDGHTPLCLSGADRLDSLTCWSSCYQPPAQAPWYQSPCSPAQFCQSSRASLR